VRRPFDRSLLSQEIQLALRGMRHGTQADSPETWHRLIRWQLEGVA
jgi:hypothetical protein